MIPLSFLTMQKNHFDIIYTLKWFIFLLANTVFREATFFT